MTLVSVRACAVNSEQTCVTGRTAYGQLQSHHCQDRSCKEILLLLLLAFTGGWTGSQVEWDNASATVLLSPLDVYDLHVKYWDMNSHPMSLLLG